MRSKYLLFSALLLAGITQETQASRIKEGLRKLDHRSFGAQPLPQALDLQSLPLKAASTTKPPPATTTLPPTHLGLTLPTELNMTSQTFLLSSSSATAGTNGYTFLFSETVLVSKTNNAMIATTNNSDGTSSVTYTNGWFNTTFFYDKNHKQTDCLPIQLFNQFNASQYIVTDQQFINSATYWETGPAPSAFNDKNNVTLYSINGSVVFYYDSTLKQVIGFSNQTSTGYPIMGSTLLFGTISNSKINYTIPTCKPNIPTTSTGCPTAPLPIPWYQYPSELSVSTNFTYLESMTNYSSSQNVTQELNSSEVQYSWFQGNQTIQVSTKSNTMVNKTSMYYQTTLTFTSGTQSNTFFYDYYGSYQYCTVATVPMFEASAYISQYQLNLNQARCVGTGAPINSTRTNDLYYQMQDPNGNIWYYDNATKTVDAELQLQYSYNNYDGTMSNDYILSGLVEGTIPSKSLWPNSTIPSCTNPVNLALTYANASACPSNNGLAKQWFTVPQELNINLLRNFDDTELIKNNKTGAISQNLQYQYQEGYLTIQVSNKQGTMVTVQSNDGYTTTTYTTGNQSVIISSSNGVVTGCNYSTVPSNTVSTFVQSLQSLLNSSVCVGKGQLFGVNQSSSSTIYLMQDKTGQIWFYDSTKKTINETLNLEGFYDEDGQIYYELEVDQVSISSLTANISLWQNNTLPTCTVANAPTTQTQNGQISYTSGCGNAHFPEQWFTYPSELQIVSNLTYADSTSVQVNSSAFPNQSFVSYEYNEGYQVLQVSSQQNTMINTTVFYGGYTSTTYTYGTQSTTFNYDQTGAYIDCTTQTVPLFNATQYIAQLQQNLNTAQCIGVGSPLNSNSNDTYYLMDDQNGNVWYYDINKQTVGGEIQQLYQYSYSGTVYNDYQVSGLSISQINSNNSLWTNTTIPQCSNPVNSPQLYANAQPCPTNANIPNPWFQVPYELQILSTNFYEGTQVQVNATGGSLFNLSYQNPSGGNQVIQVSTQNGTMVNTTSYQGGSTVTTYTNATWSVTIMTYNGVVTNCFNQSVSTNTVSSYVSNLQNLLNNAQCAGYGVPLFSNQTNEDFLMQDQNGQIWYYNQNQNSIDGTLNSLGYYAYDGLINYYFQAQQLSISTLTASESLLTSSVLPTCTQSNTTGGGGYQNNTTPPPQFNITQGCGNVTFPNPWFKYPSELSIVSNFSYIYTEGIQDNQTNTTDFNGQVVTGDYQEGVQTIQVSTINNNMVNQTILTYGFNQVTYTYGTQSNTFTYNSTNGNLLYCTTQTVPLFNATVYIQGQQQIINNATCLGSGSPLNDTTGDVFYIMGDQDGNIWYYDYSKQTIADDLQVLYQYSYDGYSYTDEQNSALQIGSISGNALWPNKTLPTCSNPVNAAQSYDNASACPSNANIPKQWYTLPTELQISSNNSYLDTEINKNSAGANIESVTYKYTGNSGLIQVSTKNNAMITANIYEGGNTTTYTIGNQSVTFEYYDGVVQYCYYSNITASSFVANLQALLNNATCVGQGKPLNTSTTVSYYLMQDSTGQIWYYNPTTKQIDDTLDLQGYYSYNGQLDYEFQAQQLVISNLTTSNSLLTNFNSLPTCNINNNGSSGSGNTNNTIPNNTNQFNETQELFAQNYNPNGCQNATFNIPWFTYPSELQVSYQQIYEYEYSSQGQAPYSSSYNASLVTIQVSNSSNNLVNQTISSNGISHVTYTFGTQSSTFIYQNNSLVDCFSQNLTTAFNANAFIQQQQQILNNAQCIGTGQPINSTTNATYYLFNDTNGNIWFYNQASNSINEELTQLYSYSSSGFQSSSFTEDYPLSINQITTSSALWPNTTIPQCTTIIPQLSPEVYLSVSSVVWILVNNQSSNTTSGSTQGSTTSNSAGNGSSSYWETQWGIETIYYFSTSNEAIIEEVYYYPNPQVTYLYKGQNLTVDYGNGTCKNTKSLSASVNVSANISAIEANWTKTTPLKIAPAIWDVQGYYPYQWMLGSDNSIYYVDLQTGDLAWHILYSNSTYINSISYYSYPLNGQNYLNSQYIWGNYSSTCQTYK